MNFQIASPCLKSCVGTSKGEILAFELIVYRRKFILCILNLTYLHYNISYIYLLIFVEVIRTNNTDSVCALVSVFLTELDFVINKVFISF